MRAALFGMGAVVTATFLSAAEVPAQPCPTTGIRCERTTTADPDTWLPLCVGTTWRYLETYASGTDQRGQIVRIRWTSTEKVVSRTSCEGGVVVRIDVTPEDVSRDYPPGLSAGLRDWFDKEVATPRTRGFAVRGGAVYNFFPSSWSEPCLLLTDQGARKLDDEAPEFVFPLEKRLMWSDRQREEEDYAAICAASHGQGEYPNPFFYYGLVEGREDLVLPWRPVRDAWHLMYPTLGGILHRWLVQHVGVVKESSSHAGSYLEQSSLLLAFRLGPGCQE